MRTRNLLACVLLAAAGAAWAKLPPAPPADPAKAAETKQKADEAAKKDAELLAKAQGKAVANYQRNKGKPPAKKK